MGSVHGCTNITRRFGHPLETGPTLHNKNCLEGSWPVQARERTLGGGIGGASNRFNGRDSSSSLPGPGRVAVGGESSSISRSSGTKAIPKDETADLLAGMHQGARSRHRGPSPNGVLSSTGSLLSSASHPPFQLAQERTFPTIPLFLHASPHTWIPSWTQIEVVTGRSVRQVSVSAA